MRELVSYTSMVTPDLSLSVESLYWAGYMHVGIPIYVYQGREDV